MPEYRLRRDAGGSTDLHPDLVTGTPLTNVQPKDESTYEREHVGPMFTAEVEGHGTITLFADEIEEVV